MPPSVIEPRSATARLLRYAVAGWCLLISLPFGSVAPWASALAFAGAAWLGAAGLWTSRRSARGSMKGCLWLPGALLFGWWLVQTIPLPMGWVSFLQPGAAGDYALLTAGGDRATIALDPAASRRGILGALSLLVLVLGVAGRSGRPAETVRWGTTLALVGVVQALAALYMAHLDPVRWAHFAGHRLTGFFSGPNTLGAVLTMSSLVTAGVLLTWMARLADQVHGRSFHLLWTQRELLRGSVAALGLGIGLAVQVLVLVLTGSRGATAAAGVAGLLLLIPGVHEVAKMPGRRVLAVIGVVVLLVVGMSAGSTYVSSWQRLADAASVQDELSWQRRLDMWATTRNVITAHPLGVGVDGLSRALPRFQDESWGAFRLNHAHNDALELVGEWGGPGAILGIAWLVIFLHRARRHARAGGADDGASPSCWMVRGLTAALAASLLHALVDFNLTSRPAVQVQAAVLLGLWIARHRPDDGRAPTGTGWLRIGAAVAAAMATILALRVVPAQMAMENAWVSSGGAPNPYHWLRRRHVPAERIAETTDRAQRWDPRDARQAYMHGRLQVRLHETAEDAAARSITENAPAIQESEAGRLARLALRPERVAAFEAARASFEQALLLSPWFADAHAERVRAIIESTMGRANDEVEEARNAARASAERALLVGAHDVLVLATLCQAIGADIASGQDLLPAAMHAALEPYGMEVLARSEDYSAAIFESWREAGFTDGELLANDTLAPVVFRALYGEANRSQDGTKAMACLEALRRSVDNGRADLSKDEDLAAAYWRGWFRWSIRLGAWDRYREQWHAYRESRSRSLDGRVANAGSDIARRLILESAAEREALNLDHRVGLARLRQQVDDRWTMPGDMVRYLFRDEGNPLPLVDLIEQGHPGWPPWTRAWAPARRAAHDGDWPTAAAMVDRLMADQDVSPRMQVALGRFRETCRTRSSGTAPGSMDTGRGWPGIAYGRGAWSLHDLRIRQDAPRSLHATVRAWDDLPADLALRVQLVTPEGRKVFAVTVRLADVTEACNAGLPPYGLDIPIAISIPGFVSADAWCLMEFRHEGDTRRIKRDDGLARVEWERWHD